MFGAARARGGPRIVFSTVCSGIDYAQLLAFVFLSTCPCSSLENKLCCRFFGFVNLLSEIDAGVVTGAGYTAETRVGISVVQTHCHPVVKRAAYPTITWPGDATGGPRTLFSAIHAGIDCALCYGVISGVLFLPF